MDHPTQANSIRDSFYRESGTRDWLSRENHLWLKSLPTTPGYDFGNFRLTCAACFTLGRAQLHLSKLTENKKSIFKRNELLVVCHTHRQMIIKASLGEIINLCLVGQPHNGSPRANCAILILLPNLEK